MFLISYMLELINIIHMLYNSNIGVKFNHDRVGYASAHCQVWLVGIILLVFSHFEQNALKRLKGAVVMSSPVWRYPLLVSPLLLPLPLDCPGSTHWFPNPGIGTGGNVRTQVLVIRPWKGLPIMSQETNR